MADATLTLGTLFTATFDKNFQAELRRMRTAVIEFNKAIEKGFPGLGKLGDSLERAKQGLKGIALGTETAEFGQAMGRASNQALKFQDALAYFGKGKGGAALKTVETDLYKVERAVQATSMRMDRAGISQGGYAQNVNRISLMNQVLDGKLKATSTGFTRVGKATGEVTKQKEKAITATKKVGEQYVGLNKQIAKVAGGLNRIKAAFKVTASYGIAATAIYTVIGAMKSGISEIINYDQALKNLQAITGATDAETLAMGNTIQDVARTTKFSTTEVAAGMVLLGQAGFDAGEAMNAMQATANLATGTLGDMALVTDLMTTTIRAFNLNTIESARVADVMANAINKSKLTIDKLRVAFNYVGATAAQAGLSLEETAASMMTLANNGLRASTIGTGLRQVLARMIAPNEKLREAYIDHGIAIDKITPKAGKFQEAIKYLSEVLVEADGKTVDMSKAFQLFGLRGAQAAAILVKSYLTGDFKNMLDKVYEVGTAEAMAIKQAEGLGVSLKNLADRAKLIAVALGEAGVSGILKGLVDLLAWAVSGIETLAKTVGGQAVVQFAAWTATIWAAIKASQLLSVTQLGKSIAHLSTSIAANIVLLGTWTTASNLLWTVWNRLAMHPFFLIAAGIAATVVAFHTLLTATDRAQKKAEKLVVENQRVKDSLLVYRGALENLNKRQKEGEDVGNEYSAMLKRLAKDHKNIGRLVDLNAISHKNLIEKITELVNAAERMGMSGYVESLRQTIIQFERLTMSMTLAGSTFGEYMLPVFSDQSQLELLQKALRDDVKALDELTTKYPEVVAKIDQFRFTIYSVVARLMTLINSFGMARAEAEKFTHSFDGLIIQGINVGEMLRTKLIAGLDAYDKRQVEITKTIEKTLLEKIPAHYRAMYAKLDALQKAHFLTTLLQIEKRADAEIERLEKQTKDVRILEAMREEIRIEGMKKFFDAQQKEGKLSKEQYIQFLNDEKAALGRWVTEAKQELKKRYGAERELLTKRTKDEEVELEKSIALIKGYVEKRARIDAAYIGKLVALESLLTKARQEEIDKRIQARYEEIQRDIAAGDDRVKKLQQQEEEILNTFKWTQEQKLTIAYYFNRKYMALMKELTDDAIRLEIEALNLQDRKIEAYDKEIEYLKERSDALRVQLGDMVGLDPVQLQAMYNQLNDLLNRIVKLQKQKAEEQKRIDVEVLNERLFNIQKYSDEYTRLMEGAAAAGLVTIKELQRYYDDLIKYRAENEEKAWRLGEISAEQYFSTIEALYRRGLITAEEFYSKQIVLQGDWLENLKEGMRKAMAALKTWNETMQQIGEEVGDQLSINLTSGLLDFVEGTKTASQAFEDFARNTLRWLAEIIVKQTLLNMLVGAFPWLKGLGGGGGEGMFAPFITSHGGGVIGKTPMPVRMVNPMAFLNAPRLHKGLARNEFPAILEKGETVIPKGESGKPPSVNINIENNTGAGLKAKQKEVRWNGQEWVVNVWLDAYTRNAFGLRDSVGV